VVPALAGSRIPLLMVTTMSTPSDKVFERLLQHRDSILRQHRWLAGDEVSPTLAADAWQINAGNLATELRKYAVLLDAISAGMLTGPMVFPSWDESSTVGNTAYNGPGTYEFTFIVVMDGEDMADALEQARDYLSNPKVEPAEIQCLEEGEAK